MPIGDKVINNLAEDRTDEKKNVDSKSVVKLIKESLEDDKALDISVIDLSGKTSIADYMVIASGTSQRHVSTMSEHIFRKLKKNGCRSSMEGQDKSDWVLIDAYEVIVHIFRPEVRNFYDLEKMWGEGMERPSLAKGKKESA